MNILGLETSCDETSASVIRADREKLEVLSNIVSSQVKLHARWGGVVPNLAAREHLKNILPVTETAIREAGLKLAAIDLIAVTAGPGLIPALLIGTNAAKTIAYLAQKPLIGVHHIEGHIYANFISKREDIKFPILCLVVSGGHTQLIYMKEHLSYQIIGETLDDAAGEAFDKVARILKLGYPGGPIVSRKAAEIAAGNKYKLLAKNLPRPMMSSPGYNFSFSGLKTAVLYAVKKDEKLLRKKRFIAEMSHEFQQAVIDVLVAKTIRAALEFKPRTIMLAGGVSANLELRRQLGNAITEKLPATVSYRIPDLEYTGDNGAMIAAAGNFRWQESKDKKRNLTGWKNLSADANLKLD